jgi:NitT/TauT family transport system ATP-binding protein
LIDSIAPANFKIAARNINHSFGIDGVAGRRAALESVDLDVAEHQFVSIVGPSGCGKTTLLNMVAGFIAPMGGEVLIDGVRVAGLQPDRIAYMFARDVLLPWRRVIGNVQLAMDLGSSKPHRKKRKAMAADLLAAVGLSDFSDYFPSQLSQGMRQRVALARTIAVNAEIWLMDEPFAALDANTRTLMQAEFMRIWEGTRSTVLFVTHDLVEAILMSDRVVVMSARPGRIQSTHVIDLPRPRDVISLQADASFHELYRQLWNDLKGGLKESAEIEQSHAGDEGSRLHG